MRDLSRILVIAAAVVLAACSRNEPATEPTMEAAGANEVVDRNPIALTAEQFINAAAASDEFGISSSKLALEKADSGDIKKFAQSMIEAHGQSTAKLKAAAAGLPSPIKVDPVLNASQRKTLDDLRAQTSLTFDAAYAAAQIDAHQMALATLSDYAATGDAPALKTFANDLMPAVKDHLRMANDIKPLM